MKFVDYKIFHGNRFTPFQSPVKIVLYDPGPVAVLRIVFAAPLALPGDRTGIRIQKNFVFVKPKSFFLVIGTVQPVGIFKFLDIQTEYDHGIDETDLVIVRKF